MTGKEGLSMAGRNRKKSQGSITVFMALILSLVVSLICTGIESVRMAERRSWQEWILVYILCLHSMIRHF